VIPGASVTLVSELTGDVRAAATNEARGGCSFGGRSITSSNATAVRDRRLDGPVRRRRHQVNRRFGQVIGIRAPRVMQIALRFVF